MSTLKIETINDYPVIVNGEKITTNREVIFDDWSSATYDVRTNEVIDVNGLWAIGETRKKLIEDRFNITLIE